MRKWGGTCLHVVPPHSVDLSWRHCFSSKNNQNHSFCAEFHELLFEIIRIEKSYVENPQKTIWTALGRSKWDSGSRSALRFRFLMCYGAPKDMFRSVLPFQLFPNASGMHRLTLAAHMAMFTGMTVKLILRSLFYPFKSGCFFSRISKAKTVIVSS